MCVSEVNYSFEATGINFLWGINGTAVFIVMGLKT